MSENVLYVGKDLEAMSFAVNYHKWILREFRPFLGKSVVEVGAGTGSFSELLLDQQFETASLVEPSEMIASLRQNLSTLATKTQIVFYQSIFAEVADQIAAEQKPDSICYVNVLEHIEDDLAELGLVHKALSKGGRCFIFVPALMSLYGNFDRKIGHFRRYQKKELEEKCQSAGFKILKSKYLDLPGIIPWYIKYRLLKSDALESGAVKLYDRVAVPLIELSERLTRVPIGKNILIVAEKV